MDQLSAMATFVNVVEAGSLSGAARAAHASLTSVSRQVAWLEAHYGTQLLLRTTRRLALTDAGRLLYDRVKTILSEVREIDAALSSSQHQLTGRLRMSAPSLMGRLLIAPVLPDLLRRHPQLSLDLLLLDRPVDLLAEDIHVALRIGRLPDSQLIAHRLGELTMVVCAAPDYLDRRGEPQSPRELVRHDCLVFSDTPGAAVWRFRVRDGAEQKIHVSGRLWINSLDSLVLAATAGLGLARVPSWQVKHAIETGRLRRILTAYELPPTPVQLVFPAARLGAPKTRALVDHLAACWRSSGEL
ncbi:MULTISPECIES: LysR family transcriptional regulator [unclassified Bradyrhizobium]|uniref:LysR family transcriptional regulator n=1 Tax=unclassified Bradyrhizobium TaxID=2631580 RepID=UPI0029167D98|nr:MULTISPECIES: LysR family transcriptional regulator [unclassified Bradyrhizobium]